ncbi:MAG: hypothetical protein ACLFR7_05685, partial [Opitutales bacterium]
MASLPHPLCRLLTLVLGLACSLPPALWAQTVVDGGNTPPVAVVQPNVVIDSDDATIYLDGVDSAGDFRGTPYTATVYNGRARFLFAGDLAFEATDVVVAEGLAAISFTVSGDVIIPEGARIDVSADGLTHGPGGGRPGDGGAGGDHGARGDRGTGGGGGNGGGRGRLTWSDSFIPYPILSQPGSGADGNPGISGKNGVEGKTGARGADGASGYRAPNTGGTGPDGGLRGWFGSGGNRAFEYADGGARGYSH